MDNDIELDISRHGEPGRYEVHVVRSPGGGDQREQVDLDVEALLRSRPLLEASILSSVVEARRMTPTAEVPVREVGQRLFETLFTRSVYGAYRASLGVAEEQGERLRVVLRFGAPELAALPWEALFDPERQTYLCRQEPMVRRIPAQFNPRAPLQVSPPLQVLAMIASPRGLPQLDVEQERANLEEALRELTDAGLVEVTWVEPATWRSVHRHLLSGKWHIVHFIGHGDYDERREEGVLAFVGPDGRADPVEAGRFADLLGEADPTPRLVVLNACSSGETGSDDMLAATAPALVHSGIEAVAAMQFAVSDDAAIAFAHGFYTAVAQSRGVDEAARSGRIAILGAAGSLEWLTPVLYLRGNSTHPIVMSPRAEPRPEKDARPQVSGSRERTASAPDPDVDERPRPSSVPKVPTQPTRAPVTATHAPAGRSPAPERTDAPTTRIRAIDIAPPPSKPSPPRTAWRRPGRWVLVGAAAALLVVAAVVGAQVVGGGERTSSRPSLGDQIALVPTRLTPPGPTRIMTLDTGNLAAGLHPWVEPADKLHGSTLQANIDRFAATPSPDRTQVAYLQGAKEGLPVIYIADADGRHPRELMTSPKSPCQNAKRPAWSEDGRRLAVVCLFPPGNEWSLWTVDARTGAGLDQIVAREGEYELGSPTWDWAGHRLYTWEAAPPHTAGQLGQLGRPVSLPDDSDQPSTPSPVAPLTGDDYTEPDWGSRGLLMVRRVSPGDGRVVVVADNGRTWVQPGSYRTAAWSPDNKSIITTVNVKQGSQELVVVPYEENAAPEATGFEGFFGAPNWGTR